jgi:hypothetical protein
MLCNPMVAPRNSLSAAALAPGTRGYTKAIVAAQMLPQIGAFALPALLPGYIASWSLSKTEAAG